MKIWGLPLPGVNLHEFENDYRVKCGHPGEVELGSYRILNLKDGVKAVIAKGNNMAKKRKNSAVRMNPKKKYSTALRYASVQARDLSNKLGNIAEVEEMHGNPINYPKSKAGRPRKRGRPTTRKHHKIFQRGRKSHITWWVLDLYDVKDHRVNTLIGQGDKDQARHEAQNYVGKHSAGKKIYRVELCGPYYFKPSKDVVRK